MPVGIFAFDCRRCGEQVPAPSHETEERFLDAVPEFYIMAAKVILADE